MLLDGCLPLLVPVRKALQVDLVLDDLLRVFEPEPRVKPPFMKRVL